MTDIHIERAANLPISERLADVFRAFIRPGIQEWKVFSSNGQPNNFDPLTLINSLIESEVDLECCFDFFDVVVDHLQQSVQDDRLTHAQIHAAVVKALVESANPHARYWLANYENVYGPDTDVLDDTPEFVNARSVKALRGVIAEALGFDGEIGSRIHTRESADPRIITNRFIKLIRYCGFYRVPIAFLQSFIRELSEYSVKGFVPRPTLTQAEVESALERADMFLVSARSEVGASAGSARTFLEFALEEIGRVCLTQFRFFPATAQGSFRILSSLLNSADKLRQDAAGTLPQLRELNQRLDDVALHRGLNISTLQAECSGILRSIAEGRFLQAITVSRRIARMLYVLLGSNSDFAALVGFSSRYDSPTYISLAHPFLSAQFRDTYFDEEQGFVEVPINFSYHELIEFGRRIRIRDHLGADGEIEEYSFEHEKADLEEADDVIPVLIVDKGVGALPGGEFSLKYERLVNATHRCVAVLYRGQFETWLRTNSDLRSEIYQPFTQLFPEAVDWKNPTYQHAAIAMPSNLRTWERITILNEIKGFDRGYGTSVALAIARLFESAVKEHTLLLYSVLKRYGGNAHVRSMVNEMPSDSSLKGLIDWWAKLRTVLPNRSGFLALVPNEVLTREIHSLRHKRNIIVHQHVEFEPFWIQEFVTSVLGVISSLNGLSQGYERCVLIPGPVEGCYTEAGSMVPTDVDEDVRCLAYRDCSREHGSIVRAYKFCTECHAIVRVLRVLGKTHICGACNHKAMLEGSWPSLVAQAERALDRGRIRTRRTSMAQGQREGTRARNWIRGLAGGLAHRIHEGADLGVAEVA